MRWHFHGQLSLVVPSGSHNKLLKFVLRLKLVLAVLVRDHQQVVSLAHSILVHQGDRAVAKDGLLLGCDLRRLVMFEPDWNSLLRRKDDVVDKSLWV